MTYYSISSLPILREWVDDVLIAYKKLHLNPGNYQELKMSNDIYTRILEHLTERGAVIIGDKITVPIDMYGHISKINVDYIFNLISILLDLNYYTTLQLVNLNLLFPYASISVETYARRYGLYQSPLSEQIVFPFNNGGYHGLYDYLFIVSPTDNRINQANIVEEGKTFSAKLEEDDRKYIQKLLN